jgi:hypothetical protein
MNENPLRMQRVFILDSRAIKCRQVFPPDGEKAIFIFFLSFPEHKRLKCSQVFPPDGEKAFFIFFLSFR